ncbi:hypothetical protein PoMZ_09697 [Pyricularia oryzae]|uniref:Uncharacterized protein n=1 Tax=Pyricularia oryzae TaxID=318829 RepID=A0A4P7N0G9_PYROR|nr:hypothetical protein PoMZ_09697 [Pyricularia oryzae]
MLITFFQSGRAGGGGQLGFFEVDAMKTGGKSNSFARIETVEVEVVWRFEGGGIVRPMGQPQTGSPSPPSGPAIWPDGVERKTRSRSLRNSKVEGSMAFVVGISASRLGNFASTVKSDRAPGWVAPARMPSKGKVATVAGIAQTQVGPAAYLEHSTTALARLPEVQLYASSAGFKTLSMQKSGQAGSTPWTMTSQVQKIPSTKKRGGRASHTFHCHGRTDEDGKKGFNRSGSRRFQAPLANKNGSSERKFIHEGLSPLVSVRVGHLFCR